MWILILINVSGFVGRFWVRMHKIRVPEIKADKIKHLLLLFIILRLIPPSVVYSLRSADSVIKFEK